mgnify:CR=1 FL=1
MAKKNKKNKNVQNSSNIPQESQNRGAATRITKTRTSHQSFSGPIPPPALLEQYDMVIPGAAERILSMAEKQSEHRVNLERKVVYSNSTDARLGVIFAFVLGMTALASGTYCIAIGREVSGVLVGGTGLVGIIVSFIYGTRSSSKERENKQKASQELDFEFE